MYWRIISEFSVTFPFAESHLLMWISSLCLWLSLSLDLILFLTDISRAPSRSAWCGSQAPPDSSILLCAIPWLWSTIADQIVSTWLKCYYTDLLYENLTLKISLIRHGFSTSWKGVWLDSPLRALFSEKSPAWKVHSYLSYDSYHLTWKFGTNHVAPSVHMQNKSPPSLNKWIPSNSIWLTHEYHVQMCPFFT